MHPPFRTQAGLSVRGEVAMATTRALPEETAVAMVYNGGTLAVMMATPSDLGDLALGFSLSERIVDRPDEIEAFEAVAQGEGVELRMWLGPGRAEALAQRRRALAGPVGCGLCGIESLEAALPSLSPVTARGPRLGPADVEAAVADLSRWQPLHDRTRAVHAAAFWRPGAGIVAAREDVGRHNALDKLVGALAAEGVDASEGAVVLTSRVSVEMVQKAARAGVAVVIAVSAPTAHAVRLAEGADMTLIALARGNGFDVFAHPRRVAVPGRSDVA